MRTELRTLLQTELWSLLRTILRIASRTAPVIRRLLSDRFSRPKRCNQLHTPILTTCPLARIYGRDLCSSVLSLSVCYDRILWSEVRNSKFLSSSFLSSSFLTSRFPVSSNIWSESLLAFKTFESKVKHPYRSNHYDHDAVKHRYKAHRCKAPV